ncbi:zinc finger protein-domain-containing protein [Cladorrhinum samala]|uniref:Zinc finger protein-domain-containing protein n=1 Tax=Cladorrhinum samala TaxID=585594 RepID=A0AAV9HJ85_9PEZI|nr:zinc finger protein-domain-containing protein [Cladorrhinum samala]
MKMPNQSLDRMLSLGSQAPTSSSPTAEQHAAAQERNSQTFRKIGAGACGAVFAPDGKSVAFKLAKSDDGSELWNDYKMHDRIIRAFDKYMYMIDDVRVPECYIFSPSTNQEFLDNCTGLAEAAQDVCNLPTHVLVTQRIHPLPSSTRNLLIDKYCAPRIKEEARADAANRDCLVRVYLGSLRGRTSPMFFSLRNFKLHLNQMLELQLDVEALANRMGTALAVMHWAASTDARDVEFVLGSSSAKTKTTRAGGIDLEKVEPLTYTGPPSNRFQDLFCRVIELFVLDFNQVRSITLDDEGVALAVQAWQLNDPYYPKPPGCCETPMQRNIWKTFATSYLEVSHAILSEEVGQEEKVLDLPGKFLLGISDAERNKMESRMGVGVQEGE